MGKMYSDSRYGVEKILTFPGPADISLAAGNCSQIPFDGEDIAIVEFGAVVTEAFSAGGTLATVQLREAATVLATITLASGSSIGALQTTRTVTANEISAGDTLILYHNVSNAGAGTVECYVRYKERYV